MSADEIAVITELTAIRDRGLERDQNSQRKYPKAYYKCKNDEQKQEKNDQEYLKDLKRWKIDPGKFDHNQQLMQLWGEIMSWKDESLQQTKQENDTNLHALWHQKLTDIKKRGLERGRAGGNKYPSRYLGTEEDDDAMFLKNGPPKFSDLIPLYNEIMGWKDLSRTLANRPRQHGDFIPYDRPHEPLIPPQPGSSRMRTRSNSRTVPQKGKMKSSQSEPSSSNLVGGPSSSLPSHLGALPASLRDANTFGGNELPPLSLGSPPALQLQRSTRSLSDLSQFSDRSPQAGPSPQAGSSFGTSQAGPSTRSRQGGTSNEQHISTSKKSFQKTFISFAIIFMLFTYLILLKHFSKTTTFDNEALYVEL